MQSNMKAIVIFLAIFGYVQAITYYDVLESEWNNFRKQFRKNYENEEEEQLRRQIFQDNKEIIDKHNRRYIAGEETYEMGVNQFTDLLPKEFESLMLRDLNVTELRSFADFIYTKPDDIDIPSSIDWRTEGAVSRVKNQGRCGSCWAFSAVGTLEGTHFVSTHRLIELSEKNLLDCSSVPPFRNSGCNGGNPWEALRYVMVTGGIDTEASYPYQPIQQNCKFDRRNIGAKIRGIGTVKTNSEQDLASAVANHGPISVAIYASPRFKSYRSGVFNDPSCIMQPNHAVVVVGYGHDTHGGDYWIVKNSWGSDWGESGYIRMSRNRNNQCKIASFAVYPLV